MLDDQNDKNMMRYQLMVVFLFTAALMAFYYFFAPQPNFPPPGGEQATQTPVSPTGEALPATPAGAPRPAAHTPEAIAAALPAPAEEVTPDDQINIADEDLQLTFTRIGARLLEATVLIGEQGKDSVQLVPAVSPVGDETLPLGLEFNSDYLGDSLNQRRWEGERGADGRSARFWIEVPGVARVEKHFALVPDKPHVVSAGISVTNLQDHAQRLGMDLTPAYSLVWGPNVISQDAGKGLPQEILWRKEETNTHHPTAGLAFPPPGEAYATQVREPDYLAVKSAYFVVAMKPEFEQAMGWANGTPDGFRMGVGVPRVEVAPGSTDQRAFLLYLGPTHLESLQAAWPGLDEALQFFTMFEIMDWFAKLLLGILNWFYLHVIANYGLAIIFLTVLVRLVVFPLTFKSMVSMRKMQLLAPKMEEIKAEVGDDAQELQKRTMSLYSEYGVNPLGGCLPMLLQMPVFIALYRMLWSAYEMRRAPFVGWINDLSEPDRFLQLPFAIPLPLGAQPITSLNLLPILMAIAMLISTRIMPTSGPVTNPQQKIMMNVMPVFFALITYNMASGLNLYILTSTMLGIAQNYAMHMYHIELTPKPKTEKPTRGSKHFYTAAQQRKRQMAKEAKSDKKRRDLEDAPKRRPVGRGPRN